MAEQKPPARHFVLIIAILIASVVAIAGCSSQRPAVPLVEQGGTQVTISTEPLQLCGDWPNGKTVAAYMARNYPGKGDKEALAQITENNMIGMAASSPPGDLPSHFTLYPNGRVVSVLKEFGGISSPQAEYSKVFICTDDSVRNVTEYYANLYGREVDRCVDSLSRACYTTLSDAKAVLASDRSTIDGPDGYVMSMFMKTWSANNEVFHIGTSEAGSVRGTRNTDGTENWISVFSESYGMTVIVVWPR